MLEPSVQCSILRRGGTWGDGTWGGGRGGGTWGWAGGIVYS